MSWLLHFVGVWTFVLMPWRKVLRWVGLSWLAGWMDLVSDRIAMEYAAARDAFARGVEQKVRARGRTEA